MVCRMLSTRVSLTFLFHSSVSWHLCYPWLRVTPETGQSTPQGPFSSKHCSSQVLAILKCNRVILLKKVKKSPQASRPGSVLFHPGANQMAPGKTYRQGMEAEALLCFCPPPPSSNCHSQTCRHRGANLTNGHRWTLYFQERVINRAYETRHSGRRPAADYGKERHEAGGGRRRCKRGRLEVAPAERRKGRETIQRGGSLRRGGWASHMCSPLASAVAAPRLLVLSIATQSHCLCQRRPSSSRYHWLTSSNREAALTGGQPPPPPTKCAPGPNPALGSPGRQQVL